MFRAPAPPPDHPPFSGLPVRMITVGPAAHRLAVHVSGSLPRTPLPLVCLAGYQRNMSDFADFLPLFRNLAGEQHAVVLIDLAGRGRSCRHPRGRPYLTPIEADDVLGVMDSLGIGRAVMLGQSHGGQVAMTLNVRRPGALAGAILVDAGPVADPRGLVRLRNNLRHVLSRKAEADAREALRRMLLADYPGESVARIDGLAERQLWFTRKGRAKPLFDIRLLDQLEAFDFDDILEPQWSYFDCLAPVPLMLLRTRLSDQLRRETFEEMIRRRPDARTMTITGQGCPALLDGAAETSAIADFMVEIASRAKAA